jgi:hypothetical protein
MRIRSLTKSIPVRICCTVISLLLIPASALCQTSLCDRALQAIRGDFGYRGRDGRCEGYYQAPVSSKLELVSLTVGRIRYKLEKGIRIEVRAPFMKSDTSGILHVRATALPLREYYRMDGTMRPTGVFGWPVEEVLVPKGVGENRLGVLAWILEGDDKRFVPVEVLSRDMPPPEKTQPAIHLMVRSPLQIEGLVWRSYPEGGGGQPNLLKWHKIVTTPQRAGEVFTILLPRVSAGVVNVDIQAKAVNRDQWEELPIRVLM